LLPTLSVSGSSTEGAVVRGIRNGGLLMTLVLLAGLMALLDDSVVPGGGRRLPGGAQHLPPPIGITGSPPAVAQPSGPDGRPPRRTVASEPARDHATAPAPRATTDQAGVAGSRSAGPPSATATPATPGVPDAVRIPSITVRVAPPRVLHGVPDVQVTTPTAKVRL